MPRLDAIPEERARNHNSTAASNFHSSKLVPNNEDANTQTINNNVPGHNASVPLNISNHPQKSLSSYGAPDNPSSSLKQVKIPHFNPNKLTHEDTN